MSYDILAQGLLRGRFDSSAHLPQLAYLSQTCFLKFLVNRRSLALVHS